MLGARSTSHRVEADAPRVCYTGQVRGRFISIAATVFALADPAAAQEHQELREHREGPGLGDTAPPTESRTSSLSWVRLPGAEVCATAPELARAVEARLHREVFVAPRDAQLSVEGRVAPRPGGGFTAIFSVATVTGEVLGARELDSEAEDCDALTATVAFVVAVMIDPDARAADEEPPSATPAAGQPPPAFEAAPVPPTPVSAPADGGGQEHPEPTRASGWTGEVDGGLGVAIGLLPEPAVGGFGALVIQSPWFLAAELDASLYPYSPQGTATGNAQWLAAFGGLLLCTAEAHLGAFGLRGCAGGEVGFLRVAGAVDPAQDHIAGHFLFRARLALRPWRGLVIWTRPTLAINPATDPYGYRPGGVPGTLHAPEAVAGIFDLGIGWIFD